MPVFVPTSIQIDCKRLLELQCKRIALGHKLDDHELEQQEYATRQQQDEASQTMATLWRK